MPFFNTALIRVTGTTVYIYTSDEVDLKWIVDQIGKINFVSKHKVNHLAPGWICIENFKTNKDGINAASAIIKMLVRNSWEHYNFDQYVDGHWFKKRIN